jgi:hypothetical protein
MKHNLTGQSFGRLTVTPQWESRRARKQKRRRVFWFCLCSCGNNTMIYRGSLDVLPGVYLTEKTTWAQIRSRSRNK